MKRDPRKAGFTMIEMLVSTVLVAILIVVCFFTLSTILNSWRRSEVFMDRMQQADYALAQVVSGLRSAYYPVGTEKSNDYGFALFDGGNGPETTDTIRWTKLGTAIVGESSNLSETPHVVQMYVREETGDGTPGGLTVRAWRGELRPKNEEFDPTDDEQVPPYLLVQDVQGFNCRVLDPDKPFNDDGGYNFTDEWKASNTLPRAVELTFTMKPVEEGEDPMQFRRIIEIPLWGVSQNPQVTSSSTNPDKDKSGRPSRPDAIHGGSASRHRNTPPGGTSTPGAPGGGNRPPGGGNSPPPPGGGAP